MLGRKTGLFLVSAALVSGCAPELGDAPFACDVSGTCPEGYSCQATICIRDGAQPAARRPKRVVWINAAEMFWLASPEGGATLLVNDGFTQGAHGIYEIDVRPDGAVSEPRTLVEYGDGPPIASSIVSLPDGRYGVAMLRFPKIDGDMIELELGGIERGKKDGLPAFEKLYTDTTPFLGGTEPTYISAVTSGGAVDIAWTQPSGGGQVEVVHLERSGSLWGPTKKATALLPPEILPLSGDCALFRDDSGWLTLRVGFEQFALAAVPESGGAMTFEPASDTPLFAWKEGVLSLRYGEFDEQTATYPASYLLTDPTGKVLAEDEGFVLQESLSPHVAVPFAGGALVAPLSRDPAFPELEVGFRSTTPGEPLRTVARIARESTETLYSARAFAVDDKAYLAWTEFHEASMDLWVAVTDLQGGGVMPLVTQAKRVHTWQGVDEGLLEVARAGRGRKR
ncbi:hypothetical protein [Polyangium aurulentum]|uniref:hypothetical protein n=1 Tax=Polyangium aurulentum TaxID=2567896 RepID=UPI0010AE6204|nr:hypothetical protein [Polyangium aurulentum]UQA59625.1 hypothetical protein E8A73_003710 [Polyangium aurulentum]